MTVLMLAVRENRLVIAERLIDLGAMVNEVAKVRPLSKFQTFPFGLRGP